MLIAGFLLSLALAQVPPAPVTVTFESTGVSGKAFCAELSRQTGQRFEARDDIQTKLLAIRLKAVPLTDVLSKLTYVTRSKLVEDGGAQVLIPDEVSREAMRRAAFERRVAVIKDEQDAIKPLLRRSLLNAATSKQVAKMYAATQQAMEAANKAENEVLHLQKSVQLRDDELRFPMGQAMLQMLLAIPAEQLASIPYDSAGIWSTMPTKMELAAPGDTRAMLDQFNSDNKTFTGVDGARSQGANFSSVSLSTKNQQAVLLRLEVYPSDSGSMVVSFGAYAADGRKVGEHVYPCNGSHIREEIGREPIGDPNQPELLIVPKLNREYLKFWSNYPTAADFAELKADSEFMEQFFQPEKYDPVANTIGWFLVALAEHENRNLMAEEAAEDRRLLSGTFSKHGEINAQAVKDGISSMATRGSTVIEFSDEGRWVSSRAVDEVSAYRNDFDRGALGVILRTARDNKRLTLADAAGYAANTRTRWWGPGFGAVADLHPLIPDLRGDKIFQQDVPSLAFLGRLDETQIALATSPMGLPVDALSPGAIEALQWILNFGRLSVGGLMNVYRSNPSDGIPNGLPGGGVFHLKRKETDQIYATFSDAEGKYQEQGYFTAEGLAHRMSPHPGEERDNFYDIHSLQLNHRVTYSFTFSFPNGVSLGTSIVDDEPAGPILKSIDDLPTDLRDRVKGALAKEKEGAG